MTTRTNIPRRRGPKYKLTVDAATLRTLETLGYDGAKIHAAAAMLGVDRKTFRNFLARHDEAVLALERGYSRGNQKVAKTQMEIALRGNVAMLIHLGKKRLDQTEKIEHAASPEAPPIPPTFNVQIMPPGYKAPT